MVKVTRVTAKRIGDRLLVNWNRTDLEQFRRGLEVEQEHTSDLDTAARIALDHLIEKRDYYTRLDKAGLEAFEPRVAGETYEKAWRRIARELETLGWTIRAYAPRRLVDAQLGDLPSRVEVLGAGDLNAIVARRTRRWRASRPTDRYDMRLFLDVVQRGRRKVGLRPIDFDYRGMSARDFVTEIMQIVNRKRGQKNLEQCLVHADCLQDPELAKACWVDRHGEQEEIEPPPDTQRSILRERAALAASESGYDIPKSRTGQYALKHDGKLIMRGTMDEIWRHIHRTHGFSVSHALTYEGYSIEPLHLYRVKEASEASEDRAAGSTEEAADELLLYTENTGELYGERVAIQKAARLLQLEGKWDPSVHWKLWVPWVKNGAEGYKREINKAAYFGPEVIEAAAKQMAEHEGGALGYGEQDEYLWPAPKGEANEATDFIIKRCRCGRAYTQAEWEKLSYIGIQSSGDDETELELRDCHCESTLAIERPKKKARENPVDGAALVCMGRKVEIVLRDGREVKPDARVGMLYDESGEFWSPESLLIASFEQGSEESAHGYGYFGKQAVVYEGHVDLPPEPLDSWKKLGEVKEIYYDRAGTKFPGFFRHEFNKPRGLYKLLFLFKKAAKLPAILYQRGSAFRIELPRGSIVDDRGIVLP